MRTARTLTLIAIVMLTAATGARRRPARRQQRPEPERSAAARAPEPQRHRAGLDRERGLPRRDQPDDLYRYRTYQVNVGQTPFIQVLFDSLSADTFISAYDTSYNPNSAGAPNFGFNVNWLGDAGTSGNLFPADPLFFQVVSQVDHQLVLVVSEANSGERRRGRSVPSDRRRLRRHGIHATCRSRPRCCSPASASPWRRCAAQRRG